MSSIRIVAWDFDRTVLLRRHCGGRCFASEVDTLAAHISLLFLSLVPKLLNHGILPCIATFGDQDMAFGKDTLAGEPMIRRLLEVTGLESSIVDRIQIIGFYPAMHEEEELPCVCGEDHVIPDSKHYHLHKLMKILEEQTGEQCRPEQVVFFDDDTHNIRNAKKEGFHAFPVDPNVGFTEDDWKLACRLDGLNALDVGH
jgi:hypothetical protein